MRVLESRGELDLALEPLYRKTLGHLWREYFHHDLAAERRFGRGEHARHPAAAELVPERVARVKRLLDLRSEISHGACGMRIGSARIYRRMTRNAIERAYSAR